MGTGLIPRNENPNQVPSAPNIYVMKSTDTTFGCNSTLYEGWKECRRDGKKDDVIYRSSSSVSDIVIVNRQSFCGYFLRQFVNI